MSNSQDNWWPDRQQSPLRRRILQESKAAAQERYRRMPQQKHYRAPAFPGTAAFDLKNGLREMPCAKRKQTARSHSILSPAHLDDEPAFSEDEILSMSPDEYHASVMRELDSIEQTSRSNTLSPSPRQSAACVFQDGDNALAGNVTEQPSYCATTDSINVRVCDSEILGPCQLTPQTFENMLPESGSIVDVPVMSPLQKPVTQQQIISEVKAIYAGLVMVETTCSEITRKQSKSQEGLSGQQWRELISLHRTLLQEYHDFFLTTQHPSASPALKLLATKYAMPDHMWRESMHSFLELLRQRSFSTKQNIILFGDLCTETMQNLIQHVPQLSDEWDLIKDNLQEYFAALHADGFGVPSPLIESWKHKETHWAHMRKTWFPPMKGHFFGDDNLPDWLFENFRLDELREHLQSLDESDKEVFGDDSLQGMAQLVMTGWLQYGRKIATSYHVYCQVSIFLAAMIFTASLIA